MSSSDVSPRSACGLREESESSSAAAQASGGGVPASTGKEGRTRSAGVRGWFLPGALVLLRTLIGWHFLFEGVYKLMLPGWTSGGEPLPAWSAAPYLAASTGPLAPIFRALSKSSVVGTVDVIVPLGLLAVGLSMMLGVLTEWGCLGALAFLGLFYLSAIPTTGLPQPGGEGTYLLVNKNLIEFGAVLVVFLHRTGRIAGLDLLWHRS